MEIDIIKGVDGNCIAINDYRVAGEKPWGGGKVLQTFKTTKKEILKAVGGGYKKQFSQRELWKIKEWFDAVSDINPDYVEDSDKKLISKIEDMLD